MDELKDGDYPNKDKTLNLANGLLLLSVESSIVDIVETYIKRKVMPADPVGDALHLALASYHKCDFLLTRNCNHIANANKFDHDPKKIIEYYIEIQKKHKERLLDNETETKKANTF